MVFVKYQTIPFSYFSKNAPTWFANSSCSQGLWGDAHTSVSLIQYAACSERPSAGLVMEGFPRAWPQSSAGPGGQARGVLQVNGERLNRARCWEPARRARGAALKGQGERGQERKAELDHEAPGGHAEERPLHPKGGPWGRKDCHSKRDTPRKMTLTAVWMAARGISWRRDNNEAAAAIWVREEDGLKGAEAVRVDLPRGQEGRLVRFASWRPSTEERSQDLGDYID